MKRRGEEVERCDALIRDRLAAAGVDATLSIRQLYHDREEVTAYVARVEAARCDAPDGTITRRAGRPSRR